MDTALAIGFFASLFAILDPVGNLPVFVGATTGMRPGVRRWVALRLSVFIAIALGVFLFTGRAVLVFFGISIPAFQVAGGIVLLLMGLHMIAGGSHDAKAVEAAKTSDNDFKEAGARFADVMVPLGIPLFVGPGSMSTTVLFASRAHHADQPNETLILLGLVIAGCSALTLVVLLSADVLARALREQGMAIATRIMGLIICAMAVQFMLSGLAAVMPDLFDASQLVPGG